MLVDPDRGAGIEFVEARGTFWIYAHEDEFEDSLRVWIETYRDRFPEILYPSFVRSLGEVLFYVNGLPNLTSAAIGMFREIPDYDRNIRANFALGIASSAGVENYDEILSLVREDLEENKFGVFLEFFFHKFKNPEIKSLIMESLNSGKFNNQISTVAARWKMVEAIPAIEAAYLAGSGESDLENEQYGAALHSLRRQAYANKMAELKSTAQALETALGDLSNDKLGPYAAYYLGTTKDLRALEPLRHAASGDSTKLRQEAKTALKKIEKTIH